MSSSVLIPEVEQRLSSWIKLLEKQKKEAAKKRSGKTITLSRQYGCEGYPLALALKKKLETETGEPWIIFDQSLLDKISDDNRVPQSLIKDYGIESSFFRDFFASFNKGGITKQQVYQDLAKLIVRVAKKGNAIILGRGASVLTQHLDNCFHFRLEAPHDYRVSSVAKRAHLPTEEAEKLVHEKQIKREKFQKDFLNVDFSDPKYYNAIFDHAKISFDDMVTEILAVVKIK